MMARLTPNLITTPSDIADHEYTVITTSEQGKHICTGFYYEPYSGNTMLSELLTIHSTTPINALLYPSDTIKSVLLVNNAQAIQGINERDKVLTLDTDLLSRASQATDKQGYHDNELCYEPDKANRLPAVNIQNFELLTHDPSEPLAQIKFGNYKLGQVLVTLALTDEDEGDRYWVVVIDNIGRLSDLLDDIYLDHLNIVRWIAISERTNPHHLAIAKSALNYRDFDPNTENVTQAQINAFINTG